MANNVIKRIWNQNKMVSIEALQGMAFQAEDGGHTFEISGVDDHGNPVALSGTVAGIFRRPDNADIALTGTASDGVVSVTLTDSCYTVPGKFGLTIYTTADSKKTAVYAAIGTVASTSGGAVAGDTPQDVVDLINAISAAVATIPSSYTALMAEIAPTYSNSSLYSVGSYVWYNGGLYRCITDITTAETWTAAHWTATVLGNDVGELKSDISYTNDILLGGRKILNNAYVDGSGVVQTGNYKTTCYRVKPGGIIHSIVSDEPIIYAFFENEPSLGSVSYNNSRELPLTTTVTKITVPSGCNWIAIRNTGNYSNSIDPESFTLDNINSKEYGKETAYMLTASGFDTYISLSDPAYWASGNTYPAGYVESIDVKLQSTAGGLILVDSVTKKILYKKWSTTANISVKMQIGNPFYVYVYGVYFKNDSTLPVQTYDVDASASDHDIGFVYNRSFRSGSYIFAIKVNYKNIISGNLMLKPYGFQRLFIAGDSITAGYPYMENVIGVNDDIRFGKQIARRLKYDVTFGANTGSGWVYLSGSNNAYTITQNTNFANYDVALYAFGTNDYGNNVALGTHNDAANDNTTVCAMVKWCINKIFTDNPAIVLVLSLPLNRSDRGELAGNWAYGTQNSAGYTLSDLCEQIKNICVDFGIPYIDNRVSPFNRYSLSGLLYDNLHPNSNGYKILGAHLTGEMQRIISPYYLDAYSENN